MNHYKTESIHTSIISEIESDLIETNPFAQSASSSYNNTTSKNMNTTAKTSNNMSAIGAFIAALPVIGWALSPILILVGFILAVVSISKNEKGGYRALFGSLLAVPLAFLIGAVAVMVLGS